MVNPIYSIPFLRAVGFNEAVPRKIISNGIIPEIQYPNTKIKSRKNSFFVATMLNHISFSPSKRILSCVLHSRSINKKYKTKFEKIN